MAIARRNTTFAYVSFFTHAAQNNRIDAYEIGVDGAPRGPVTSVEFTDNITSPAGKVTITLKATEPPGAFPGATWTDVIANGDWWLVDVVKNGVPVRLSFGIIDTVTVSMAPGSTGEVQTTITVQGRSFGFALEDIPMYWNPFDFAVNEEKWGRLKLFEHAFGSPDSIVKGVIEICLGVDAVLGGQLTVPAGLAGRLDFPWIDVFDMNRYVQGALRGRVANPQIINNGSSPSVWSFLEPWKHPMLNEMFVETSLGTDYLEVFLVLREKPFENRADGVGSPWFGLTQHDVDVSTLSNLAISKGMNRLNHITIIGALEAQILQDPAKLFTPFANEDSIARYGLKKIEETSNFFGATDLDPDVAPGLESTEWGNLVVDWNALNHEYWAGQIDIGEMRPEIKKGQKVRLVNGPAGQYQGFPTDVGAGAVVPGASDPAMTFYVENVTHRWTDGPSPSATTSLTVTRGYSEKLRVPDLLAEVTNWNRLTVSGSANDRDINAVSDIEILSVVGEIELATATTSVPQEGA